MRTDESLNKNILYTIGHSNHTIELFLDLLRQHKINAVADVRSAPYSRYCPQFNRENLRQSLTEIDCRYVFLGKELGGKREEKECYTEGKIDYEKASRLPIFQDGCQRLLKGICEYRIAILCSEKNPADCHRTLLISKALQDRLDIRHILDDGSTISHVQLMRQMTGSVEYDLLERADSR